MVIQDSGMFTLSLPLMPYLTSSPILHDLYPSSDYDNHTPFNPIILLNSHPISVLIPASTPYTTSLLSPCTPHIIFKLRQAAPEPTYLSKFQPNISRPKMQLHLSFNPRNLQQLLRFRRSRVMMREDMTWLCINDDFDGGAVARRDSIAE
jgi:hypothetical protein